MVVRCAFRLLILPLALAEAAGRFLWLRIRRGSPLEIWDRAHWLHAACRMILSRIGIRADFRGTAPSQGLVCSNHLTYLDILVYSAAMPCVFVSKREVSRWPLLGFFARAAGTLFIDRQSRGSTEAVARQIRSALHSGVPVLLFPEGTSTDGSTVLRFHPSLLQPAVDLGSEITAAAIGYRVRGGAEREVCWYGDASFVPHLLRTLGRAGIAAEVEFHPDRGACADRKNAALALQERVHAMRRRMNRSAAGRGLAMATPGLEE